MILAAAGVLFLAPELVNGGRGFYCRGLDYLFCTDNYTCLHETAHRLDHRLGDLSYSEDFKTTVQIYIRVAWENPRARDAMTDQIAFFPGVGAPRFTFRRFYPLMAGHMAGWGGYSELYAEMLVWADGEVDNLPACFRRFYDQALLDALLRDLKR